MKYLIRVFLFNVFSLWLTSQLVPALKITQSWPATLMAGAVLSLLMIILKPILKILFIPINILTFGLLSWFINVIVIYILTLIVPEVEVVPWTFPGLSLMGFVIPQIYLNYASALVMVTLTLTAISNILHSVSEG